MASWNYQIEPIVLEEIPPRLRQYFIKNAYNLQWQPWIKGLRYIMTHCPSCGGIYGGRVGYARMLFKNYNSEVDSVSISCPKCISFGNDSRPSVMPSSPTRNDHTQEIYG